jgi:carboxylesterase
MAAALDVSSRRFNWAPLMQCFIKVAHKGPPEAGDWQDPTAYLRHWSYSVYPLKSVADMIRLRRRVRADIRAVAAPTLIIHGLRDAAVPPASSQWLYDHISSPDKSILWLPNSGHCVTIDAERQRVWQSAHDFIQAHA